MITQQTNEHSPALNQLRLILQYERALLPAFEFCKCVGDFLGLLEEVNRQRITIQINLVDSQQDMLILEKLIEQKVSECEQQGSVLETLLLEQIEKGNEHIENIEKVLLLNQDYAFAIQQCDTLPGYYTCVRKFEYLLKQVELDLIE